MERCAGKIKASPSPRRFRSIAGTRIPRVICLQRFCSRDACVARCIWHKRGRRRRRPYERNSMPRPISKVATDWWDYTTLDPELLADAAKLTAKALLQLSRPGFKVEIIDTLEEFYLAEALEYIDAWRQATPSNPAGICGPIGPTEQLPLVARIVTSIGLKLHDAHFWGMYEWVENGKPVAIDHPLSFARADMQLCF